MGLEDLETLERIFSRSNQLATVVRYTSAYRRRVLIDLFFQQWDDERYLNLGKMLLENYKQALDVIADKELAVSNTMAQYHLTQDDLDKFTKQEREYINTVGKEDPSDTFAVAYVAALEKLRGIKCARFSFREH